MRNSASIILLGSSLLCACASGPKTEYVFENAVDRPMPLPKIVECTTSVDETNEIAARYGKSYEYSVINNHGDETCENCLRSETIIRVVDGKVVRREFSKSREEELKSTEVAAAMVTKVIAHWVETETEIGTHTEGFLPKTIEQISSSCPQKEQGTTASLF